MLTHFKMRKYINFSGKKQRGRKTTIFGAMCFLQSIKVYRKSYRIAIYPWEKQKISALRKGLVKNGSCQNFLSNAIRYFSN